MPRPQKPEPKEQGDLRQHIARIVLTTLAACGGYTREGLIDAVAAGISMTEREIYFDRHRVSFEPQTPQWDFSEAVTVSVIAALEAQGLVVKSKAWMDGRRWRYDLTHASRRPLVAAVSAMFTQPGSPNLPSASEGGRRTAWDRVLEQDGHGLQPLDTDESGSAESLQAHRGSARERILELNKRRSREEATRAPE